MRRLVFRCAAGGCLLLTALVMGCDSADVVAPVVVIDAPLLPVGASALSVSPMSLFTGAAFASLWEPDYGTGLDQVDDDCDFVSLGFTFDFYGVAYTDVWVNSNGNMTFNDCNPDWWHPDVPDGANILVAPLYGDFNPSANGDVYVNTVGTAPERRFIATWVIVPEFAGGASNTFQAQFFEGTNHIQFAYNGLTTDGINWDFSPPSTDANQDVGISSGTGSFINSASGTAIPALDGTAICYKEDGGTYVQVNGNCDVVPPVVTATLTPVLDKSLKSKKGVFTVEYSCTDDCDPDVVTTAMLNDVPVETGQVVELRLKSGKSTKVKKSEKGKKSEKPMVIESSSFALVVVCTDAFGNVATITVEPAFAEKSEKSKKDGSG